MSELYTRFQRLRIALKPIISKKDLFKLSKTNLREYYKFKAFLDIDGRYKPKTVLRVFKKYNKTGLVFKGHDLKFDLSKTGFFDEYDKFKSSAKQIAKVTNAMQLKEATLIKINQKKDLINVRYNVKSIRNVITFEVEPDIRFLEEMPEDYYINIDDTAYNKNGLDFVFDYFNQSEDYTNNLDSNVDNQELSIYTR